MVKIHSIYDLPPSDPVDFDSDDGVSLTQQHFAQECDINYILQQYGPSGVDPLNPPTAMPQFGDFSSVTDFMTANNILIDAQDHFDSLPASLRKRFDNDPLEMLKFLNDENNRQEAIDLGICNAPPDRVPDPPPGKFDAGGSPNS